LGGLIAANLLVKQGHQVTLFEANDRVGGYISGFVPGAVIGGCLAANHIG